MTVDIKNQYTSRIRRGARPGRTEQDHVSRYQFAAEYAPGKRVLDIACGTGYGSQILREAGASSVVGVDVSPDAITFARRNSAADGIEYICANAETTKSLGPFDLVVSFETIEHVHDYQQTLRNLHAMLKPGGTLIISTPNRSVTSPQAKTVNDIPDNKYHVREWNLPEFLGILREAGFGLSDSDVYGQSPPQKFTNRIVRKLNTLFGWFGDSHYRVGVRPINELPILRFITVVAHR